MIRLMSVCIGLLLICLNFSTAHALVPFSDPYLDGYVLTLWNQNYTDQELDNILSDLQKTGTKHVTVLFFACQPDMTSVEVDGCEFKPYADMLRILDHTISHGFSASILPVLSSPKGTGWRGQFQPTNVDEWFKNYTKWITKIAADAEKRKLTEFVVGTEYTTLQKYTDQWRKVIAEVRKVFSGPLIYATNWDNFNLEFWDAVDAIGVSAYFILSTNPNPSQQELNAAWEEKRTLLKQVSKKYNRPLHITEVGYPSSDAAAATPWDWSGGGKRDDELQKRCFEGLRQAWNKDKDMMRVSIWSTGGKDTQIPNITGDPIGRVAETTLNSFFQERAQMAAKAQKHLKKNKRKL